jgi:prepilin-type processing-associated H-X9-DG protein
MSDRTHLSNIAGDKKQWPVYMTIANLSSKIRQVHSTHSVVMVALLPIPIKNCNIPQKRLDELRQTHREVLNEVLWRLLQPLTLKHISSAKSGYFNVLWADGNFRRCKLVLAAWLPDWHDYSDLHHLERHVCFWCECPNNELGDYVPPVKQHPRRDHNQY